MHSTKRSPLLDGPFLTALVVLVVNDHMLKGSGVLPGSVTGKLSDFAGLFVLAVLLCQVRGLRGDRARAMVCGVVGVVFATINLSPAAATALQDATALFGFRRACGSIPQTC